MARLSEHLDHGPVAHGALLVQVDGQSARQHRRQERCGEGHRGDLHVRVGYDRAPRGHHDGGIRRGRLITLDDRPVGTLVPIGHARELVQERRFHGEVDRTTMRRIVNEALECRGLGTQRTLRRQRTLERSVVQPAVGPERDRAGQLRPPRQEHRLFGRSHQVDQRGVQCRLHHVVGTDVDLGGVDGGVEVGWIRDVVDHVQVEVEQTLLAGLERPFLRSRLSVDQGRAGAFHQGLLVDEARVDLGADREPKRKGVECRVGVVRRLHGDLQQRLVLGRDGRLRDQGELDTRLLGQGRTRPGQHASTHHEQRCQECAGSAVDAHASGPIVASGVSLGGAWRARWRRRGRPRAT